MSSVMENEIDRWALYRCLLVLLPLIFVALMSGDLRWQHALIPASAALVGLERVGLAPLGVIGQGILIILCFIALLFAQELPLLFVVCCALLAALSVALTWYAQRLRSLGTFIFVPALYMACEAAHGSLPAHYLELVYSWLPYILAGVVPVTLLAAVDHAQRADQDAGSLVRHYLKFHMNKPLGPSMAAGLSVAAVTLSVAVAALLVVSLHPENPQWIIWSAASVVTGDWVASKRKLYDRLLGALIGVPVGVVLGLLLPQVPLVGLLLSVITCATVLVLRRYVVSFGVRCACAACAIVIAHHALSAASERFFNVALGGLIGAVFVLALHLLSGNKLSEPRP